MSAKPKKSLFVPISIDLLKDPRFCRVLESVGGDAGMLWLAATLDAKERLTDGRVHGVALRRIYPYARDLGALAQALVDAGLWRRDGEDYLIAGWSDWNDSREEVEAKLESRRLADKAYQQAKRDASKADAPPSRHVIGRSSAKKSADALPTSAFVGNDEDRKLPDDVPTEGRRRADVPPVGDASAKKSADDVPIPSASDGRLSRATEIREQRLNNSNNNHSAGAHAREPASPEARSILEAIRRHPELDRLGAGMADELVGVLMGGKPMALIVQGIDECARDLRASEKSVDEVALAKMLRGYVRTAERRQLAQDGPASGRQGGSGPPTLRGRQGPPEAEYRGLTDEEMTRGMPEAEKAAFLAKVAERRAAAGAA